MWAAAVRSRSLRFSSFSLSESLHPWKLSFTSFNHSLATPTTADEKDKCLLNLSEIEKVLNDVKADDVKIIPVQHQCDWADFMVFATGRSTWHVKNIAQALLYKAKQKQKGAERMLLPSVEGQESGKWVVIDSGKVIVHALDEKARAYYDLESHWISKMSPKENLEDLAKLYVKVRPKNNSKKKPPPPPPQKSA